jgi:hypothetical protein
MKLHHTGFIVNDLNFWEKNMLYEEKIADIIDSFQNARLALYKNYSNSFIELIQPLSEQSNTWNSLMKKGNHFNHFCYELENFEELKLLISSMRMVKVLGPVQAPLFGYRDIYFYMTKNRQVVEFIINS